MVIQLIFQSSPLNLTRIILGILLFFTAALKFPDLKGFADIVQHYNIMPRKLARFLAYLQPFGEFFISLMLLIGSQLILTAALNLLSLSVATFFIAYALARKNKLKNCGCFGTSFEIPVSLKKLAENLFWILLSLYLLLGAIQLGL